MAVVDFIDKINKWVGEICSFLIIPLFGIITFEVILRYVFNMPTIWVHDTSGYILASYALLAGGYVHLNRSHINVDIIYNRFSPKAQAIISLTTFVFFLVFACPVSWYLLKACIESIKVWEHSWTTWGALIWPIRLVMLVGVILILLQGFANFIHDLISFISKKK